MGKDEYIYGLSRRRARGLAIYTCMVVSGSLEYTWVECKSLSLWTFACKRNVCVHSVYNTYVFAIVSEEGETLESQKR